MKYFIFFSKKVIHHGCIVQVTDFSQDIELHMTLLEKPESAEYDDLFRKVSADETKTTEKVGSQITSVQSSPTKKIVHQTESLWTILEQISINAL